MNSIEGSIDFPRPDKSKSYDELRRHGHSGMLMKKEKVFFNCIPCWNKRYVVIYSNCVYMFKSETDNSYDKAFSLFGYRQVSRADEAKTKSGQFPFKLVFSLDEVDRFKYFSGSSEDQRIVWMKALKREMEKAHNMNAFDTSSMSSHDSGIFDTETPISSGDYFDRFKRKKDETDDDSDLESEYIYIKDQHTKPVISSSTAIKKPPPPPPTCALPPIPVDEERSSFNNAEKIEKQLKSLQKPKNRLLEPQSSAPSSKPRLPNREVSPHSIPRPILKTDDLKKALETAQIKNIPKSPVVEKSKSPPPPIPKKPDFEKQSRWDGDPAEGTKILLQYGVEGTFMIRKGNHDLDVLMAICEYQPRKFKIFQCEEKVSLNGVEQFDCINNLISHYKSNSLPNRETKLKQPYTDRLPKQFSFV